MNVSLRKLLVGFLGLTLGLGTLPAYALRDEQRVEGKKAGLEEIEKALQIEQSIASLRAAGLEEWAGGPGIRIYTEKDPSRNRDNRAVVYHFNAEGDQLWMRLFPAPADDLWGRKPRLLFQATDSDGEPISQTGIVIYRATVLRDILLEVEAAGRLPQGTLRRIWNGVTGRFNFDDPETLRVLHSDPLRDELAKSKKVIAEREEKRAGKSILGLVLTLGQSVKSIIAFHTGGDTPTGWHPFMEVVIRGVSPSHVNLGFSAPQRVIIDRERVYETRHSSPTPRPTPAAGLEAGEEPPSIRELVEKGALPAQPESLASTNAVQVGALLPEQEELGRAVAAQPGASRLISLDGVVDLRQQQPSREETITAGGLEEMNRRNFLAMAASLAVTLYEGLFEVSVGKAATLADNSVVGALNVEEGAHLTLRAKIDSAASGPFRILVQKGAAVPAAFEGIPTLELSDNLEVAEQQLKEQAREGDVALMAPRAEEAADTWNDLLRHYKVTGLLLTQKALIDMRRLSPEALNTFFATIQNAGGLIQITGVAEKKIQNERTLFIWA